MKIVRPGNTEFNLLFAQFCEKNCKLSEDENNEIKNIRKCYTDWIYKTAGYYDKEVPRKNKYEYPVDYTEKLSKFIDNMTLCLKNSTEVAALGLDWMISRNTPLVKYVDQFKTYYNLNLRGGNFDARRTLPHILSKKVLVISPFKELFDQQMHNGNLLKIRPELSKSTFITYKFPYTFLNNGPHQDCIETLEIIKDDIKNNYTDFDIAILSCGCYGSFLVDMICEEMKKDAIYVGGQLPLIFGIIGKRDKWAIKELYKNDTTYLTNGVPQEFRPDGWEKIEDGCYW